MSAREWFVSYDVTQRQIVLQYAGDDEHPVSPTEASALSDELRAAVLAHSEHRWLRGDDQPSAGHQHSSSCEEGPNHPGPCHPETTRFGSNRENEG